MIQKDLLETIADAVGEAWGTLLSKAVGLACEEPVEAESLSTSIEAPCVRVDIEFGGDLEGRSSLWLDRVQALTMVGMMMSMGADDALIDSTREGDLGPDELDGLKETFNQFSATAATVLRDRLGCAVQAELGEVQIVEELEGGPETFGPGDEAVVYGLSLEGYDGSELVQIFESSLVASIENASSGEETSSGEVDEAGPAVETVAASGGDASTGTGDISNIRGLVVNTELILAERTMEMEQFLKLVVGSVIELWKPCDHPAELMIQDTVIANGEVVMMQNQHFGLRVLELAPKKKFYQQGVS